MDLDAVENITTACAAGTTSRARGCGTWPLATTQRLVQPVARAHQRLRHDHSASTAPRRRVSLDLFVVSSRHGGDGGGGDDHPTRSTRRATHSFTSVKFTAHSPPPTPPGGGPPASGVRTRSLRPTSRRQLRGDDGDLALGAARAARHALGVARRRVVVAAVVGARDGWRLRPSRAATMCRSTRYAIRERDRVLAHAAKIAEARRDVAPRDRRRRRVAVDHRRHARHRAGALGRRRRAFSTLRSLPCPATRVATRCSVTVSASEDRR